MGALQTNLVNLRKVLANNSLPARSAGYLPGQDVPALGTRVAVGRLQGDGVCGVSSKLHVHWYGGIRVIESKLTIIC